MTVQRLFVLRFANGKSLAYGVPEFLGDEEVADFLAYAQDELVSGAAQYRVSCCPPRARRPDDALGGDGDDGGGQVAVQTRQLTFGRAPSRRMRELQGYANQLRDMGERSRALREREEFEEREAAWARQREADRQHALSRDQGRGR